jgi:hypothetical protein
MDNTSPYARLWHVAPRANGDLGPVVSVLDKALEFLLRQGLEDQDPDAALDRRLHAIAEPHEEPFARLALRCRASAEAKTKLESHWRKCCAILTGSSAMGDLPLPELADMASLILDDVGELEPDGPGQARPFVPFLVQMLRSWDPDKAGLPTWTRLSVDGHSGLKRFLRDYRIQFISPWAFLAHRMTESSLVEAWSQYAKLVNIPREKAVRLLQGFQAAYADAKHDYRQRSGRRIGWQPDEVFFLRVDPASPPETTEVHLRGMVRVVRYLKVGPPATSLDRDSGSDSAPGPAIPDGDNPMQRLEQRDQQRVDRLQQSAQMERLRQLLRISTVFPPAYKPAATLLHRHGERLLCVCRAQAAGRSLEANVAALQRTQSQIACDCHTSQPTVSRDRFTLEEWASTIADTATEQLIGSPGFERLDASEAALERISVQLQTYLLAPLRLGEEAPLCKAIDLHLRSR